MSLLRARICEICGFFAFESNFVSHVKSEGIRLLPSHELIKGTTLDTTSEEFQQRFRHLNLQKKSHEGWIDWRIYSRKERLTE